MMERDVTRIGSAEYYRIDVAADMVGLPSARVKRYLKVGLVQAPVVDRGKPLLSDAELIRLRKIRRLTTDLGINLAGVEVVLRLLDQIETLQAGARPQKRGRSQSTLP
jgi:MerR family transcriptional regulator/heat shock protein HspR